MNFTSGDEGRAFFDADILIYADDASRAIRVAPVMDAAS